MSSPDHLTIPKVRSLAGDLWFARGEAYLAQGRVKDLRELQSKLSATVEGSRTYRVRLWVEEGEIRSSCSCPLGDDEHFCKHCVAVALAWVESDGERVESIQPTQQSGDDLRSFLEQQEKQKLIEIVLREASENRPLRDRLSLEAARSNFSGVDLSVFRKSIGERGIQPQRGCDICLHRQRWRNPVGVE